jgi:hypothetical protein
MAKKFDLSALLDVVPELLKLADTKWDAVSNDVAESSKKAAKAAAERAEVLAKEAAQAAEKAKQLAKRQAKNPVAQWVTVGLAVALIAGVAYALFKPDEDDLWQQAEDEVGSEDA